MKRSYGVRSGKSYSRLTSLDRRKPQERNRRFIGSQQYLPADGRDDG